MSYFTKISAKLQIDTAQFVKGLTRASVAADKFSKKLAKDFQKINKVTSQANTNISAFAGGAKSHFKNVERIIQGILISQMFYRLARHVQEAVGAVWDLSIASEQAQISFAGLLRDQEQSLRLMSAIERFAAYTPYTFEQSADMGRRLLAYGFQAENLLYVMDRLSDAAAASGRIDTFDRVGLAIGQIWTKGRLLGQEIRQLTEAGIPAAKILQEELGLTQEQLIDIGRMAIPADVAVGALLRGMEKRYGGAAEALSLTVKGLQSTIVDNFLLISKEVIAPAYESVRNNLYRLRNTLDEWRKITAEKGFGGLFEHLIPKEWQSFFRLFITNLAMLKDNALILLDALKPVAGVIIAVFMQAINVVLPPVQALLRILLGLLWAASQTKVFKFLVASITALFIAGAVAKVLLALRTAIMSLWITKVIAQGVIGLFRALRLLALASITNPWVALFATATAVFLAFALSSDKVRKAVTNLGSSIYKAMGYDTSKVFAPTMKENTEITDEFNKELAATTSTMEDLGDEAKKAGKKAKQALLSFDEVFTLNDPDVGEGAEDLEEVISIPDLEIPEVSFPMPEFTDQIDQWVGRFTTHLKDQFTRSLKGAGLGAIIGGLIGTLLAPGAGTILGAKIGAAAGALAGYFWDSVKQKLSDVAAGLSLGSLIGAIIGTIIAPGPGTAIGMLVGGAAGALVDYFWESFANYIVTNAAGFGIGAIVGGVLGTILAPGPGTAIGVAIGSLVGSIVSYFWDQIKEFFMDHSKGIGLGGVVGGVIGTLLAPGPGTAIGVAIGSLIGGIVSYFWDSIKTQFANWFDEGVPKALAAVLARLLDPTGLLGPKLKDIVHNIISYLITYLKQKLANIEVLGVRIGDIFGIDTSRGGSGGGARTSGTPGGTYFPSNSPLQHARGGIFNKEHIASFAEGDKMEAILPVENPAAMAQVRRAIFGGEPSEFFRGLVQSVQPSQAMTPVYVGTLIADDRGLRELERRMYDIRVIEEQRRGE